MKLATVSVNGREQACLWTDRGCVPLEAINSRAGRRWSTELHALISGGELQGLNTWHRSDGPEMLADPEVRAIPIVGAHFGPPYRNPGKIWGIGLNYREHAQDLSEDVPEGIPGSFIKPTTTVIGPGDTIEIPRMSERTTAEAELGVIIGKRCKDVAREDWLSVVAGFTTIIDMTAEDILRRNPRFLTVCKSFDTFFSFGPQVLTPDEIDNVMSLNVSTVINGAVHATNTVSNMTYPPDFLVSFHSQVMTLLPGDIISTGTPGAVPIADGDTVTCRIDGFEELVNPVRDLKNS